MSETRLADRTLEAVIEFYGARRSALFVREQERAILLASMNLEPAVLSWVSDAWIAQRSLLSRGEVVVEGTPEGKRALAAISDQGRLAGLLFVETDSNRFTDERDQSALKQIAHIAGLALAAPLALPVAQAGIELFLERSSPEDVARRQLLVIMDRHEWNIAQVARLLRVTRATIYNRLEKLGIERRRISKASLPPKRQTA